MLAFIASITIAVVVAQTAPLTSAADFITITTPATSGPSTAPGLTCTGGSTVLYTRECTLGHPISYCHSPDPPIQCSTGSYPSVWYPVRCYSESTCFPVPTTTSTCERGETVYTTYTNYDGTLADGLSTVIQQYGFACSGWVSWQSTSPYTSACLPTYTPGESACASYFDKSATTYSFTLEDGEVSTIARTMCFCPSGQIASYTAQSAPATCVAEVTPIDKVFTRETIDPSVS